MIIRKKSYPRAGLIGNPSDGYFGKTIAFAFRNFCAEVILYETPELEILPNLRDHSRFTSLSALVDDVQLFGYYGGIRLLKAAVKRFDDHCRQKGIVLHDRNFTLRYDSDIPHLVGLAGSSAIITACMRALMAFYGITIPKPDLATLVLSVETDELQISAGLQDRVAQAYQGLVYMDFNEAMMETRGYGEYVELDPAVLPPLYIAYRTELAEISGVFHRGLHHRYLAKDPDVLSAIEAWAAMTDDVRKALGASDSTPLGDIMDRNFDTRAALGGVNDGNLELVSLARSVGASAKLTGSGGAIIGTISGDAMFARLQEVCDSHGIVVLKPDIAPAIGEETS